jgi:3-deoxy-D-manno-octulosonic-acid transferase
MVQGRLTLSLKPLPPAPERPRVLVHGVSVGEVKAAKSLVAELSKTCEVVISSSTNTGMRVARQCYPDYQVVRFPVDHMWPVTRFMNRVQPSCVILMELEIWPNFLRKANRLEVPVAIVSGRITPSSHTSYRRFGTTLPQFPRITVFAVQDEEHAQRFADLAGSRERVVITGNVKIDGLDTGQLVDDGVLAELRGLVDAQPGQFVLVAGSTHDPEEGLVAKAFRQAAPGARVILVPRHPERGRAVLSDLAEQGMGGQLLTDLRAGREELDTARALIVDTIGELESIYRLADVVFVGGSLVPHGGQNMLEPAALGRAVVHGPHVENFTQEARLLEKAGGSRIVRDPSHLAEVLEQLLKDPVQRELMGQAGREAVEAQKGATARTLRVLADRCGLRL